MNTLLKAILKFCTTNQLFKSGSMKQKNRVGLELFERNGREKRQICSLNARNSV